MLLTQRILYAVAFDAIEAQVTAQVADISKALGAPVYLLATVASRYDFWRAAGDEQARAREKLEAVAQSLRDRRARVGHTMVVKGNAAVAAMEAAERMQTDFIVLGAGDKSLQDPAFVRTTAKTLARSAEQHIWICKPQVESALGHILCAFNDSHGAAAGLHISTDLARQFNAKMQLMSVLNPPPTGLWGGDENERDEALETNRQMVMDEREGLIESFNFHGVTLARNLCWSELASQAILAEAQTHHDGLLVMGVAGRRRFPTMMLGNTAEKILRNCRSSLLVVK